MASLFCDSLSVSLPPFLRTISKVNLKTRWLEPDGLGRLVLMKLHKGSGIYGRLVPFGSARLNRLSLWGFFLMSPSLFSPVQPGCHSNRGAQLWLRQKGHPGGPMKGCRFHHPLTCPRAALNAVTHCHFLKSFSLSIFQQLGGFSAIILGRQRGRWWYPGAG